MPRDIYRSFFALAVIAGIGCWVMLGIESCHKAGETVHERKAIELKGAADVHAAQGRSEAAAATEAAKPTQAATAEVDRLKSELANLKRRLVPKPHAPVDGAPAVGAVPDPGGDAPDAPDDRDLVIAKQDEVIKAQDVRFAAVVVERDHWKAAYGEANAAFRTERDRSLQLELALEAQKALTKSALWKGRIQGLAIGFGAGYVSGRLR